MHFPLLPSSMRSSAVVFSAALTAALLITVFGCTTTPPENTRAAQAIKGEALYNQYCISCHGSEGTGRIDDSMMADPADLTTIVARRGGGEFPVLEIARIIDGRNMLESHSNRDMPLWGDIFSQKGELTEDDIKGQLAEIIAYLMSMQQ